MQFDMDVEAAGLRLLMDSGVALSDTIKGLIPGLPDKITGGAGGSAVLDCSSWLTAACYAVGGR